MRKLLIAALGVLAGIAAASAQSFPSRPVTAVVPASAGGPTDTIGRIVMARAQQLLGQTIVVENVGGASGTIGTGRVVRAEPDGYTIGIGGVNHYVVNASVYPLPYDTLRDFEPISMLSIGPLWIIARKDFPAKDTKELIAWLKANPNKATGGTIGIGSAIHMCLIYFADKTGTTMQYVPYRGAAPMLQDVLAGQIDLSCPEAGQTLSQYRAGNFKAYAVLTEKRWFAAPDVPTMDEIGVPGVHFPFWHGLWAPKGTPKDVVAKINDAAIKALSDPALEKRFASLGMTIPAKAELTPQALHDYHKAETDKWWPIIKSYGIKVN